MPITQNDITFTYSGGNSNSDPDESLGGESSSIPISSQTLFSDVSPEESEGGLIDYRCFYLHNENVSDSLYETTIEIVQTSGNSIIQIGVYENNEKQIITVVSPETITNGSFTLTYTDALGDHNFVVHWNSDVDVWGNNLQTALRTIAGLEDVVVTTFFTDGSSSSIIFEIEFAGTAGQRYHDLISMYSNNLSPATTVGISRLVAGGPINSEATEIDIATTIPNEVSFYDPHEILEIGELKSLDSVPIWIKRTVYAGEEASEGDNFTFRLSGRPVA